MNIYTYEITLVVESEFNNDNGSKTICVDIKATSRLNAVILAIKQYAPVCEVIGVSRII